MITVLKYTVGFDNAALFLQGSFYLCPLNRNQKKIPSVNNRWDQKNI
jgi:hypothetical protein